jgi:hypothetical protein
MWRCDAFNAKVKALKCDWPAEVHEERLQLRRDQINVNRKLHDKPPITCQDLIKWEHD